jgi:hypothetical protein
MDWAACNIFEDILPQTSTGADMAISMDHGGHRLSKHWTAVLERPLSLSVAS